ncbi:zinc ribbon domain-containing protein [Thalassomonas viridans]|uniref:zinc ribbon domain-containing protein n=1 Tax=Thalassomonas viridans TaxID=137584 RepID=UPI00069D9209|nr:zinc ribbon domain-containing protein [Thalassomonas viridans]
MTSYTSQQCPHWHQGNRKTQTNFTCVQCGFTENADVVGAMHILAREHRELTCGESALAGSMKQELKVA